MWKRFCGSLFEAFVPDHHTRWLKLLLERRRTCESYYIKCNEANRRAQRERNAGASESKSALATVIQSEKEEASVSQSRTLKSSAERKAGGKAGVFSSTVGVKPVAAKKYEKDSEKNKDLDVYHRIR